MSHLFVIPGLVPGIQPTAFAGAGGALDPGDKHRDDNSRSTRMYDDNAARFYRIEVRRPA
jgi:hypothetical protein